ncbi:MAG: DUF2784 family protein [Candidatus Zambryskibacteria bacterium]|nr:DUF2784 family protein [Candidatus Zambryskibacteria bacterium]
MSSRFYFRLHLTSFVILMLFSLTSPLLAVKYVNFFSSDLYLFITAGLVGCIVLSWRIFPGCPLTVWEKSALKKEGKKVYAEQSFLGYFSRSVFKLEIKDYLINIILFILYIIPILAGIYAKYL